MKTMKMHHGEEVDKWIDALENEQEAYLSIKNFLVSVDHMETFYSWPKEKQKRIEAEFYIYEKRLLCYLANGKDKGNQDRLVLHILKVYKTLIYKYTGWYQKSVYSCLGYNSDEVKTMIEALFVDTVHYYLSMYKDVRIPFGSFVKKRIFIQFRGELQDVYRKTILYEQWKDRLYEKSQPLKTEYETAREYDEVEERMALLKNYALQNPISQENCFDDSFMYNYIFIYFFLNKRPFSLLTDRIGYNYKSVVNEIRQDIKIFKEKVHESRYNNTY